MEIYLLIYLFYSSKNILIVHFLKASYRSWSIQAVKAANYNCQIHCFSLLLFFYQQPPQTIFDLHYVKKVKLNFVAKANSSTSCHRRRCCRLRLLSSFPVSLRFHVKEKKRREQFSFPMDLLLVFLLEHFSGFFIRYRLYYGYMDLFDFPIFHNFQPLLLSYKLDVLRFYRLGDLSPSEVLSLGTLVSTWSSQ